VKAVRPPPQHSFLPDDESRVRECSLWIRRHGAGLSVVGVLAIGFGGWLGGEMVYIKGMAVEAVEKLAKKTEKPSPRRAA
jgi:hypothetical protein